MVQSKTKQSFQEHVPPQFIATSASPLFRRTAPPTEPDAHTRLKSYKPVKIGQSWPTEYFFNSGKNERKFCGETFAVKTYRIEPQKETIL